MKKWKLAINKIIYIFNKNKKIKTGTIIFVSALVVFLVINFTILNESVIDNKLTLPIINYGEIITDDTVLKDDMTTPLILEKDLLYLKDNGYNVISQNDLLDFYEKNMDLPENPVLLIFSSSNYSTLEYALPILEKYEAPAVFAISGNLIESRTIDEKVDIATSNLSIKELIKLRNNDLIDFANNSYELHTITENRNGINKNIDEEFLQYQNILVADIMKMEKFLLENCGIKANTFSLPFGYYSKETIDILGNMTYEIVYTFDEKINILDKEERGVHLLSRTPRHHNLTTKEFMDLLES